MDNKNKNTTSHARRHPDSIRYTGGQDTRQKLANDTVRKSTPDRSATKTAGRVPAAPDRQGRAERDRINVSNPVRDRAEDTQRPQNTQNAQRPQNTQNTQNVQRPQNTQNAQRGEGYKFTSGTSRRSPDGRETSLSLSATEEAKIRRYQRRREIDVRREEKWQNEVVRVRGGVDMFMLAIILVLLALGSITVFSASYPYAIAKGLDSNYYIISQIKWVIIGAVVMTVMVFFPIKWYKGWAPLIAYGISAVLLVVVLFIGSSEGEAVRWIDFGFFNVQPSELMKISLVLMLGWYADKFCDKMKDLDHGLESYKWNVFFPCLILGVGCILVLIGKHLSGTIIVGAIGVFMLVVAGCKLSWLLMTAIPAGAAAVGLFILKNPYALKRITTFTDENADKLDELYQTTQSILAIGSGGLFGVGLGQSRQKYSYLGAAHTDFIFSIWCEEWGFIGAVLLIALFLLFIWRGYLIAVRAPDKFTMLVAFGITTHVGLQAFLNMCVASDLIMNTGITLPFFSYGGSSLIVLMMEMGILLCISRQYYRKKSDIEREELVKKAELNNNDRRDI